MAEANNHEIVSFPTSRLATIDIGAAAFGKHHICALIEFDVTKAREKIRQLADEGDKISFNAWVIKCIGEAISENKLIHGIRKGKREIIIFDDIDISIMVEREVDGEKVPLPYVIRKVNGKNIREISTEIEAAKKQLIKGEENYVLGESKNNLIMKSYYALPGFIRSFFWQQAIKRPFLVKHNMGTVMITSVGMMGEVHGWVIPTSLHPLCFAIGSIVKKPGVVNDQIEIREVLYLTALVDHDVIDGAPAIRSLTYLKKLVETAFGI